MTQPAVLGRPSDQDQLDEQARAWEDALVALATAALLAAIVKAIARAHAHIAAGLAGAAIRVQLVAALRPLQVAIAAPVLARIEEGVQLGAEQAVTTVAELSNAFADEAAAGADLGPDMVAAIQQLDTNVRTGLNQAVTLAEVLPMETIGDVTAVQAAATRPVNDAAAQVSWWANHAINAGTMAVAERSGAEMVWLAERDACLVCLALSGQTVRPGEEFDVDATFDASPMPMFPIRDPAPLYHPPRHPHCRCRLRLWLPDGLPAGVSLPDTLRREAQRSVARGFSWYASHRVKLSAAGRLLNAAGGTRLPRSVVARGRHDVRRGQFSSRHNLNLPSLPPGR